MVWLGWTILRPRRLARGLRLRPLPPVRLRMRLSSRLRGVLPAVPILSTLFLRGILPAVSLLSALRLRRALPAVSILSAVLQLRRVHADVSVLSTGLRLCGVLPEIPILSARALLLVVGLPHTKTADGPNERRATSAVIATALVRRCAEPGAQSGVTRAGFFAPAQSLSSPLCARGEIAASRAPHTRTKQDPRRPRATRRRRPRSRGQVRCVANSWHAPRFRILPCENGTITPNRC